MKRFFMMMAIAATMVALTSCSDDDGPQINRVVVDFEGTEWSAFNAATLGKSYSSELMTEGYVWRDKATSLTMEPIFSAYEDYKFYAGGFSVSSYNTADCATYGSYEYDLYLYNSLSRNSTQGGGHNGSNNFIVGYGNLDSLVPEEPDARPTLYFADGVARAIKGCYVASTSYFVNVANNGNAFAEKLGDNDEVKLYATGYDAAGRVTGQAEMSFARKGRLTTEWTAWDLSALGKVVKVQFNILGGPSTPYGMTTPKYFAIDDITIEWEQK